MIIEPSEILSQLPKKIYDITVEVSRRGFILNLVGGSVRDFVLTKKLGKDLDFELKHLFEYDADQWERKLDSLISHLCKMFHLEYEKLNFLVYRIKVDDFELEFSSPRIEKIIDKENKTHQYFSPEFVSNLEIEKAYLRRDFTINAMAIHFGVAGSPDEFSILDPFNALDDIKKKQLHPCSDNFKFDYVRLLRAVRFRTKLDFDYSESLKNCFQNMSLEKATAHYLKYEMFKTDFVKFLKELKTLISDYKINSNDTLNVVLRITEVEQSSFYDRDNFLLWLSFHKNLKIEDKEVIISKLGYSIKKSKPLIKISELLLDENKSAEDFVYLFDSILKYRLEDTLKFNEMDVLKNYAIKLSKIKFDNKDQFTADKCALIKTML